MNVNWFFTLVDSITSPIRRIFQWIGQFIPGLRQLSNLPLPKLTALIAFAILLIVYIASIISYRRSDAYMPRAWTIWLVLFVLVCVIPVIVYFLTKALMSKEASRFPSIDQIWDQALQQCAHQGIALRNVPIFLLLGGRDSQVASELLKAAQIQLSVSVPAQRGGDIGFFANQQMVFISVNGCSYVSGLVAAPSQPSYNQAADVAPAVGGLDATMNPAQYMRSKQSVDATSDFGATLGGMDPIVPASEVVDKTMVIPEGQVPMDIEELNRMLESSHAVGSYSAMLTSQEIFDRDQKLRYLSGLITKARTTLCPINGILTILPFDLVESASGQLQTAIKKDLQVLRESLQVRCPHSILVSGLDQDEGFQELIKRVGDRECRDARFGRGNNLWSAPESEHLDAIVAHAAGAFEDWIYVLFQRENALQQRYNSRLLSLLCRVRGRFAENLRQVISRGCGYDPHMEPELAQTQFLFSGCYFAGTDSRRPAFLKSAIAKLIQQEGELEWAPSARLRDRQFQFLGNLFALIGGLSFLAIVLMIAWSSTR